MTEQLQCQQVYFKRVWAMPHHRTFTIKPIAELREKELTFKNHIEPFPFNAQMDCFEYLSHFENESVDEVETDPPYSKRQVSEWYKQNNITVTGWHTSSGWISKLKNEVTRVLKPGGKTITYGWNSSGMGKSRGFELLGGIIVCHGGEHNDTICTVETKIQERLTQ